MANGRWMASTFRAGWITAGLLGLLLVVVLVGSRKRLSAGPAPLQAGVSKEAAISAEAKFRQIQEGSSAAQPFGSIRISETELNSYVRYDMEPEFPPGISNLQLKLQPGRPQGTTEVDFDKLKGGFKNPPNPLIAYFLSGVHTLGVEGTLSGANGVGQFHLETVTLDNTVLPQPVVEFLVDHYLKAHFPAAALDRPFALSFGIDRLNVESGSVLLTSRPIAANNSKGLGSVVRPRF